MRSRDLVYGVEAVLTMIEGFRPRVRFLGRTRTGQCLVELLEPIGACFKIGDRFPVRLIDLTKVAKPIEPQDGKQDHAWHTAAPSQPRNPSTEEKPMLYAAKIKNSIQAANTMDEIVAVLDKVQTDFPELQEAMDEEVHEAKSSEAAEINNEGSDKQIDYLSGGNLAVAREIATTLVQKAVDLAPRHVAQDRA